MPSRITTVTHSIRMLRGRLGAGVAVAVIGLLFAAPAGAGDSKHRSASKREKAMLDMVEKVSFPHEELEKRAPVKAKIPVAPRKSPARARGHARKVVDAQPGVVHEPAPAPAAPVAPVAAAAPAVDPEEAKLEEKIARPQDVSPETGKSIDALVAKAFDPTARPARDDHQPSVVAEPGSPNTDEIAAVMKPVRAQVKSRCSFGTRGVVTVRVEVGAGGRVADVTPEGPLAERAGASCVADAVRRARFPASAHATFRYPFSVK